MKRISELTEKEKKELLEEFLKYKPLFDENPHPSRNHDLLSGYPDFAQITYSHGIGPGGYMMRYMQMREKHSAGNIMELSREKLDFEEILTVFIFLDRSKRHSGGLGPNDFYDEICRNLLGRLDEIE